MTIPNNLNSSDSQEPFQKHGGLFFVGNIGQVTEIMSAGRWARDYHVLKYLLYYAAGASKGRFGAAEGEYNRRPSI